MPATTRCTPGAVAAALRTGAHALEAAGASLPVVDCAPPAPGDALARADSAPGAGIGAGPLCPEPVRVLYDALGIPRDRSARRTHCHHRRSE